MHPWSVVEITSIFVSPSRKLSRGGRRFPKSQHLGICLGIPEIWFSCSASRYRLLMGITQYRKTVAGAMWVGGAFRVTAPNLPQKIAKVLKVREVLKAPLYEMNAWPTTCVSVSRAARDRLTSGNCCESYICRTLQSSNIQTLRAHKILILHTRRSIPLPVNFPCSRFKLFLLTMLANGQRTSWAAGVYSY